MRDTPWSGVPGNGNLQGIQRAVGVGPPLFYYPLLPYIVSLYTIILLL